MPYAYGPLGEDPATFSYWRVAGLWLFVALDHRCPRHRIFPFQGPVLCHQMITDR